MILNLPQKELLHSLLVDWVCHPQWQDIEEAASRHQKNHTVPQIQSMLDTWYQSLEISPDYSVYSHDFYISELWACWHNYSRIHLKNIQKSSNLNGTSIQQFHAGAKTIVDLGCGFGLTTAALSELFPDANVIGTNLDGTLQTTVAKKLGQKYKFTVVSEIQDIDRSADLIFASEYFEHWINPIEHLEEVVTTLSPRAMLIANAFGTTAIGHFTKYRHGGQWIDQKKIGRMFNAALRDMNYTKVKTGLWNDRPSYWVNSDTN